MPLQFLSASHQHMQFVDLEARVQAPVDPSELEPNHRYAVLMFLQNADGEEYKNVTVTAWHDTFEVGVRGLSSLIIQSPPVDIPAPSRDTPGIAMVRFLFMSPSAGRGHLAAKVMPLGPSVVQPVHIRSYVAPAYQANSGCSSARTPK